jgi:hypothetical protein
VNLLLKLPGANIVNSISVYLRRSVRMFRLFNPYAVLEMFITRYFCGSMLIFWLLCEFVKKLLFFF